VFIAFFNLFNGNNMSFTIKIEKHPVAPHAQPVAVGVIYQRLDIGATRELLQLAAFRKNQSALRRRQFAELAGGFFGVSDGVHTLNYTLIIGFIKQNLIIFFLDIPAHQGIIRPLPQKTVVGISLLKWSGEEPQCSRRAAFLLPECASLWAPRRGRSNAGRCSTGKANPVSVAHLISLRLAVQEPQLEHTMTHTQTPAQSRPSSDDIQKLRSTVEMFDDIQKLCSTVEFIDALSQEGFSKIYSIARVTLVALENKEKYLSQEDIAHALETISGVAFDIENCINCEAENVDCNHTDEARYRRMDAYNAQQLRMAVHTTQKNMEAST
jgi:hypothetical protein